VTDADNKLFLVVEQRFDFSPDLSSPEQAKRLDQPPQYMLTDVLGHFLWDVIKLPNGHYQAASGMLYKPVGT
jgi:hypothetical protein